MRASETRAFCPPLSVTPRSPISVCSPAANRLRSRSRAQALHTSWNQPASYSYLRTVRGNSNSKIDSMAGGGGRGGERERERERERKRESDNVAFKLEGGGDQSTHDVKGKRVLSRHAYRKMMFSRIVAGKTHAICGVYST